MWKGRIVSVMAAVFTAMLGAAATPGWASRPGGPVYGDITGDGLTDRVTLALAPPNSCAVTVQPGLPGGGYGTATVHLYPEPGGDDGVHQCPDLGVIVDLGGNGSIELVVGYSPGRPPGVAGDLLVLRNYQVSAIYPSAIFQPSYIGAAEFNGDGRKDVYEWSDQGDGFASYLSTATGGLVTGPVRFCAVPLSVVQLADFDRNRAMDLAMAYTEGCTGAFSGVVVVFDNGTTLPLQSSADGTEFWTSSVADANQDGIPDVRTANLVTGEVSHFITMGPRALVEAPAPKADVVTVVVPNGTSIPILANDAVTSAVQVSIVVPPRLGTAVVTPAKVVVYTPPPSLSGPTATDQFVYQVVDDGKVARATVTVQLRA
jgi:hypothetical protein